MPAYNFLDIGILIVFALLTVMGIIRGFFRAVFGLAGAVMGFGLGVALARPIGARIQPFLGTQSELPSVIVAFAGIYLGAWIAGTLIGFLLRKILKTLKLGWFDRMLGGGFGAFKALLAVSAILIVLTRFPDFEPLLKGSIAAPGLIGFSRAVVKWMPEDWQSYVNPQRWLGSVQIKDLRKLAAPLAPKQSPAQTPKPASPAPTAKPESGSTVKPSSDGLQ